MTKVTIAFTTDNDAFQQNPEAEIEHVLAQAREMIASKSCGPLWDSNGNTVGHVEVK